MSRRPWLKRLIIAGSVLLVAAIVAAVYILTEKFADTATVRADYTVSAMNILQEFRENGNLANKKYTEKIILVSGKVSEIETIDTVVNIKFIDTATGAYAIFAFQAQHMADAKKVKAGDSIAIKGSCSGGVHSEILETDYVTFKRCAINK